MKLKIVSDGTPLGTRILNADTNEPVEIFCTRICWEIDVGNLGKATFVVPNVEVELVGEWRQGNLPFPEEDNG